MGVRLSNTLAAGKKEEFRPLNANEVGMYICGPTVYDEPHIGHLRSAYIFDVIRRYLIRRGYRVRCVRNVTDIDDKIIHKAREAGATSDLPRTVKEVAEKYYRVYSLWLAKAGVEPPDIEPWATRHIPQIQEAVSSLIQKGNAYVAGGDVYYSVRSFPAYGKLSGRSLDELLAGARVEPEEHKKDPLDFALWKRAKQNEPSWESPWGIGRPGWHIECSVMSMLYLGESFDIHCGGQDLIFPHHENEIAQAEAVTNKTFARYWLHNGMLTIDGQKMSKSLGNFVTVEDALKEFNPDVIKLFFLSGHYRSSLDFSWQKMKEFRQAKTRLDSFLARTADLRQNETSVPPKGDLPKNFNSYRAELHDFDQAFYRAMDDDFNTARAQGVIYELVNLGNRILDEQGLIFSQKVILLSEVRKSVLNSGEIFSLFRTSPAQEEEIDFLVGIMIKIREELRRQKQFHLADQIRRELAAAKIFIEDGKEKTTWRK